MVRCGIFRAITFQYCRDALHVTEFDDPVMAQGWAEIYRNAGEAHVGLVDESWEANGWAELKTVQLCIRVPDVMLGKNESSP